jgi:transforming growth factor-beta-induced protein
VVTPSRTGGSGTRSQTAPRALRASYDRDSDREPNLLVKAATAGTFRTLINLLVAADLAQTLADDGPFTVFAPSDDALNKIPYHDLINLLLPENKAKLTKILTLHVVPGRLKASTLASKGRVKTVNGAKLNVAENRHGLAIGEATVVKADIECGNGVIHVIDRLLLPTASSTDVLGLVESKKTFTVLLSAIKAAGLEDALGGDGPFTILAPTDDAFGKLPKETLAALLKPSNRSKLASILKYHVIPGALTARDVIAAGRATTLQGSTVEATIDDGRLAINGARVLASDLKAENGIVHAIDAVLIPH